MIRALLGEELLEPVARWFRFRQAAPWLNSLSAAQEPVIVIDFGCGPHLRFFKYASRYGLQMRRYIGIDPLISDSVVQEHEAQSAVKFLRADFHQLPKKLASTATLVSAFAFLEHIDDPEGAFAVAWDVLRPGGLFILTTPSPGSKNILEFLSFKLGIISPREIAEHKQYFTQEKLLILSQRKAWQIEQLSSFEVGLNTLLVLRKPKRVQ